MKNNIRLVLLALLVAAGQNAWAEVVGGNCGWEYDSKNTYHADWLTKMQWSLDTETGVLQIWGDGEMGEQNQGEPYWCDYLSQIKEVYIEGEVSNIRGEAFAGCTNLKNVVIATSYMTEIQALAFSGCTSLTDFTMVCNDDIEVVCEGNYTSFKGANPNVTLHVSRTFGNNTHYSCCNDDGYFAGWRYDNVLKGTNRFGMTWEWNDTEGASSLSVGGPDTLTSKNLTDLTLWEAITQYSDYPDKLIVGNGTETISEDLFNCCEFKEIEIGEGVKMIKNYAFGDMYSLLKLSLPSTLQEIEGNAFLDCEVLEYIKFNGTNAPYFYEGCFSGIAETGTVVLPVGNSFSVGSFYYAGIPLEWTKTTSYDTKQAVLYHGVAYTATEDMENANVFYTREVGKSEVGQWLPLTLPFSFSANAERDDYEIAEIHDIIPTKDDNFNGEIDAHDELKLTLIPFNGNTEPNVTYMIRPKSEGAMRVGGYEFNKNKTRYAAVSNPVTFSTSRVKYSVTGLYDNFEITPGGDYFYVKNGKLVHPTENETIEPFSWVLKVTKRNSNGTLFIKELKEKPLKIVVLGDDYQAPTISRVAKIVEDLKAGIQTVDKSNLDDAVNEILSE